MRERSTAPHRGANRPPKGYALNLALRVQISPTNPPAPSTRGGETAVVLSNLAGKQVWFFCTVVFWEIFKTGLGGKDRWATCKVVHGAASARRWSTGAPGASQAVHTLVVWSGQMSTGALTKSGASQFSASLGALLASI